MAANKTLRRFCVMSYNQPPLYLVVISRSYFIFHVSKAGKTVKFDRKRENFGYDEKKRENLGYFRKKTGFWLYLEKNFFGKRASRRYNGEISRFYFGKGMSRRYK